LKSAWANSSAKLYLVKPFTKIELVEWLKVKAEFKPQCCKTKQRYSHI
jgi:hypothetical protein